MMPTCKNSVPNARLCKQLKRAELEKGIQEMATAYFEKGLRSERCK